jgi:hypothetical protein
MDVLPKGITFPHNKCVNAFQLPKEMVFSPWKWLHIAFRHGCIALGTFGYSLRQMCCLSITLGK